MDGYGFLAYPHGHLSENDTSNISLSPGYPNERNNIIALFNAGFYRFKQRAVV